jgi:hypothetical protein
MSSSWPVTSSRSSDLGRALRLAAPAVPYASVLLGLYALGNAWVAVLGYHVGIAVVLTLARAWPSARSLLRGFCARSVLLLAPVFLLAGPAIYLAWPLAHLESVELGSALSDLGLDSSALVFFAWYSVANPWIEELYWRGFLGSDRAAPVLADVLFGGYHVLVLWLLVDWPFAVAAGVVLAATGWLWRMLVRRCGGLLVPALTHLVADAAIVAAIFALI